VGVGKYRYLFQPLQLGPITVRNRVVFSAHLTNYAEDGLPTEQHAAYYEARARGGAGLIITEEHSTHPTDWPYEKLIHGFHQNVIPGYKRITEAVHRHGTPIFAQINHNGGQASSMYSRLPVWAPSPVADPLFREVPKAVNVREIAEIVAGYGIVARHCAEGGFDGVELQCSHSSIVRGFLSGATNTRTDSYGGSLENRSRLLVEIIDVVREAIGPTRALGVRLCGDELIEGGTTIDEAVAISRIVEATGKVDYINTSIGVATATLFMIEASMHIPPGYALFIPNAIRRAVDIPVVGVGRFKDPIQAERALADGHCDLVGAVRAQIADPDFVRKAQAGLHDDTRLCLSCNQECVGRMGLNRWLGCIENPATGREALLSAQSAFKAGAVPLRTADPVGTAGTIGTIVTAGTVVDMQTSPAATVSARADRLIRRLAGGKTTELVNIPVTLGSKPPPRKRVMVVGAGPAGLQAAISAASHGHDVTVYERELVAGGQVRWAATVPNRAEFGDLIRNQLNEAARANVKVVYGHGVDSGFVGTDKPDVVIIATGAVPARPYWAPGDAANIVDVMAVLTGKAIPSAGAKVVIVDELGFHQATSIAEVLADRGCNVEILTPGMVVGQDLGITLDMENFCIRAAAKKITLTPDSVVMGWIANPLSSAPHDSSAQSSDAAGSGVLSVLHHVSGSMNELAADWVVLAVPGSPADALYRELHTKGVNVHRIGDALTPRRAHSAVIDGDRIGAAL
jgi:2,4-dienoyl-CoA reductase-like NADH-dependent reductase (Old Yellow Enzyme family)